MAWFAASSSDDKYDMSDIWRRAADVMVERGIITRSQLRQALDIHTSTKRDIGYVIATLGFTSADTVAMAVAKVCDLQYFNFKRHKVDPAAVGLLPDEVIRRLGVLPVVFAGDDKVVVAVGDPGEAAARALEEIASCLHDCGFVPVPVIAERRELADMISYQLSPPR